MIIVHEVNGLLRLKFGAEQVKKADTNGLAWHLRGKEMRKWYSRDILEDVLFWETERQTILSWRSSAIFFLVCFSKMNVSKLSIQILFCLWLRVYWRTSFSCNTEIFPRRTQSARMHCLVRKESWRKQLWKRTINRKSQKISFYMQVSLCIFWSREECVAQEIHLQSLGTTERPRDV